MKGARGQGHPQRDSPECKARGGGVERRQELLSVGGAGAPAAWPRQEGHPLPCDSRYLPQNSVTRGTH